MKRISKIKVVVKPQGLMLLVSLLLVAAALLLRPAAPEQLSGVPAQALGAASTRPAAMDCSVEKCIALTFDDGPDPKLTPHILDTLKHRNAKATFFVQGRHVPSNEGLLKRMHAEGHEIGNHSWNHPYFTRIPIEQVRNEIASTQAAVAKAGVPVPSLFRPPYGDINAEVASQIPLTIVRWDIDPGDWSTSRRDNLISHIIERARPGSIVVMHDTAPNTVEKLGALITQLESQSYKMVTVSEALGILPGQQGTFFSRNR